MSYCRWSTDKCRSDVYAYEAADEERGSSYVVHIRGKRPVNPEIIPDLPWQDLECFLNLPYEERITIINTWQREHREAMDNLVWESINLPYGDKTFGFDDAEGLYECLVELREVGYHIPSGICPESALESIKEEFDD